MPLQVLTFECDMNVATEWRWKRHKFDSFLGDGPMEFQWWFPYKVGTNQLQMELQTPQVEVN